MAIDGPGVLAAADQFLREFESADLLNRKEMEQVRKQIVRDVREDARETVKGMQTQRFGRTLNLVPNTANRRNAELLSQRTRQRVSRFGVRYLNEGQIKLLQNGRGGDVPVGEFVRNSHRLAKATREYLKRVAELDPNAQEEVDRVLEQMENNRTDLLSMEVKSWKKMRENVQRAINGRLERSEALESVTNWDIDKNLWNLSVVEHPKASVRGMMDDAARRFGGQVTTKASEVPKRSFIFAASPPNAVSAMTPESRSATVQWRQFSLEALAGHYRKLPVRGSLSTSSGLGLGFNTKELYVPIPPEAVEETGELLKERRRIFLADMETRGEVVAEEKARKAAEKAEAEEAERKRQAEE